MSRDAFEEDKVFAGVALAVASWQIRVELNQFL